MNMHVGHLAIVQGTLASHRLQHYLFTGQEMLKMHWICICPLLKYYATMRFLP